MYVYIRIFFVLKLYLVHAYALDTYVFTTDPCVPYWAARLGPEATCTNDTTEEKNQASSKRELFGEFRLAVRIGYVFRK